MPWSTEPIQTLSTHQLWWVIDDSDDDVHDGDDHDSGDDDKDDDIDMTTVMMFLMVMMLFTFSWLSTPQMDHDPRNPAYIVTQVR